MSQESVRKIYSTFLAQVERACAEGRGEELFLAYHRAIGADLAEVVFLTINSSIQASDRSGEHDAAERILGKLQHASDDMISSIRETFIASGYSLGLVSGRCEQAAKEGLTSRFNELVAATGRPGAA